jgi:hypothetical protein
MGGVRDPRLMGDPRLAASVPRDPRQAVAAAAPVAPSYATGKVVGHSKSDP